MGLLRFSSEFACWGGRILRFENRIVCFPPWKGFRRKDGTREGKRSTSGVSLIVPAVCGRPMPRALGGRQGSPGPPPFFWVPRGRPFWEGTGAATTVFGVAFVEFHGADGRLVPWKRPPPSLWLSFIFRLMQGGGGDVGLWRRFQNVFPPGNANLHCRPTPSKEAIPSGVCESFFSVFLLENSGSHSSSPFRLVSAGSDWAKKPARPLAFSSKPGVGQNRPPYEASFGPVEAIPTAHRFPSKKRIGAHGTGVPNLKNSPRPGGGQFSVPAKWAWATPLPIIANTSFLRKGAAASFPIEKIAGIT